MRRNIFSVPFLFALVLMSTVAQASNNDTQQPIHIEADQAEISEREGVMTYTGHVLLKQGGIELRADTVKVFSQDGELQRITAEGNPVHYLQKKLQSQSQTTQNPVEEEIKGVSQSMEYRAKDKRLVLVGNAEFWQGGNRFSGNRIQYDPETERVIASAGDQTENTQTDNRKSSRVSVTLQPKKSDANGATTK